MNIRFPAGTRVYVLAAELPSGKIRFGGDPGTYGPVRRWLAYEAVGKTIVSAHATMEEALAAVAALRAGGQP